MTEKTLEELEGELRGIEEAVSWHEHRVARLTLKAHHLKGKMMVVKRDLNHLRLKE